MATSVDYHNIYRYFIDVTTDLLMGNIDTLETHNQTLDVLTDCNQTLTQAWTTGQAPDGSTLQSQLNAIIAAGTGTSAQAQALQEFINNYLSSGNPNAIPISQFSQAIGAQLLNLVAGCYSQLGDNASADMSTVNSFNSIITSQSTLEEQTGQNEAKTEGSVVQQDSSAQQPIANCADSMEGVFGNIASLVQQVYS